MAKVKSSKRKLYDTEVHSLAHKMATVRGLPADSHPTLLDYNLAVVALEHISDTLNININRLGMAYVVPPEALDEIDDLLTDGFRKE